MTLAAPLLACMALSASLNGIPARVLAALHAVEGGQIGSVHRNANGTSDYGVMQVNSRWVPTLAAGLGLPAGDVRQRLIADGCFNILIAGAIFGIYLDEENGDLARATGDYNSHTAWFNASYQLKVGIAALRQTQLEQCHKKYVARTKRCGRSAGC